MWNTSLFSANNIALKRKRKTLSANDVLEALDEMEFSSFLEPLKEGLESNLFFIFCL